jgi:phenylacetate-CoA ligase
LPKPEPTTCSATDAIEDRSRVAFQSREAVAACTDRLLREHLEYCFAHSPFYRRRFEQSDVQPRDIGGVADLVKLPVTTKADLASCGDDFLCLSEDRIVDVCQTSGTTGTPVGLLQSERDLRRLAYNEARCFAAAGLSARDRVLVACALGRCFMAGLAYFEGLRRLGACAIRVGAGSPAVLAEAVLTHRPSALVGVPSVLLATAENLADQGVAVPELGVKRLIGIGEPLREADLSLSALGQRLQDTWQAPVRGTYASTEMATSFAECAEGDGGGHVLPDLIAVEILDEADTPVAPGAPGELVATPLQVTGMPLLRIRTGDIVVRITEPCACGRRTDRLGPVLGRRAQMLKIRGTTVYPTAVFALLQGIAGVADYCMEIHDDFELSDRAEVFVSLAPEAGVTREQIAARLQARLRVKLPVTIQPAESLRRRTHVEGKRKPVRVFDARKRKPYA